MTLTQENQSYKLTIKDKNGRQVFSGPYNTERGVKSLPEKAQAQLKIMKLEDLNVMVPKRGTDKKEVSSSRKKSDKLL